MQRLPKLKVYGSLQTVSMQTRLHTRNPVWMDGCTMS